MLENIWNIKWLIPFWLQQLFEQSILPCLWLCSAEMWIWTAVRLYSATSPLTWTDLSSIIKHIIAWILMEWTHTHTPFCISKYTNFFWSFYILQPFHNTRYLRYLYPHNDNRRIKKDSEDNLIIDYNCGSFLINVK